MRDLVVFTRLQRILLAFQMDWAILDAEMKGSEPTTEERVERLERLKSFAITMRQEVENETLLWVAEFTAALTRIDQQVELQAPKTSKSTSA
jgi:hypothetical protein